MDDSRNALWIKPYPLFNCQEMKEIKRTQGHHACPQCDYKTGNVSHLKMHVRTVHKQREEEEVELLLLMRTTTS